MRLPNRYGSVKKLKGKRRRPYAVIITTGRDPATGEQIRGYLDYYRTKNEALQALSDYNNDPYDPAISRTTFAKLYEKWFEHFMPGKSSETERTYEAAFKDCVNIHLYKMVELNQNILQNVLDTIPKGRSSIERVKTLFVKIFDYAVERKYIKSNPAADLQLPEIKDTDVYKKRPRTAFFSNEISQLWEYFNSGIAYVPDDVKIALMLIYSGVRINELLKLKKEDCDLKNQYFIVRESKTDAGRNRIVPIADKLLPFWEYFYNTSNCPFVVHNASGDELKYDNFSKNYWSKMAKREKFEHTTHETRHTFISLMSKANVNSTITKKIVGHVYNQSMTEAVYTHFEISDLLYAVNKITP